MLALAPGLLGFAPLDITELGVPVSAFTEYGEIEGRRDADTGVDRFFGVPIADSAGGQNRWREPQPYPKGGWSGVKQTLVEKPCLQLRSDNVIYGQTDEDCISVDIIKPMESTGLLPVVVWAHGGGFQTEDMPFEEMVNEYYAAGDPQNLGYLPNDGKVVTVLLHYRLGPLGFMAHPGLTLENSFKSVNPYSGSGNYGLMDGVRALEWVRDNIVSFGGDSSMVTLMGESAGGGYALLLSASPLTQGLIHHTIAQSPWPSFVGGGAFSLAMRETASGLLVHAAGCGDAGTPTGDVLTLGDQVFCMRSADYTSLFTAVSSVETTDAFNLAHFEVCLDQCMDIVDWNDLHAIPVIDGYVLTKPPLLHWSEDGVNAGVNFIVGQNADEYNAYYPDDGTDWNGPFYSIVDIGWKLMFNDEGSHAMTFDQQVGRMMTIGQDAKLMGSVNTYYTDKVGVADSYQRAVQKASDLYFTTSITAVIDALTSQSARIPGTVHRYVFGQHEPIPEEFGLQMGAYHGAELSFVWGLYTRGGSYIMTLLPESMRFPVPWSTGDFEMGVSMKKYWVNMMYQGTPNLYISSAGLQTAWTGTTTTEKHTLVFVGSLLSGAALDPCSRFHSCLLEQTGDFRRAQSTMIRSSFALSDSSVDVSTCQWSVPAVNYSNSVRNPPYGSCSEPISLTFSIAYRGGGTSASARRKLQVHWSEDPAVLSALAQVVGTSAGVAGSAVEAQVVDVSAGVMVTITFTITVPAGTVPSDVQAVAQAALGSPVQVSTAFGSVVPGILVLSVPFSQLFDEFLPQCDCYNFRNGLTYAHLGEQACARSEVHGHEGDRVWCAPAQRPFVPYADSGCSSDTYRCVVTYIPPVHEACVCDSYANGAQAGDEMCVKSSHGGRQCYPRVPFPTDVGGHFHFGCASDMTPCV